MIVPQLFKSKQSAISSFASIRLTSPLVLLLLEELLKSSRERVETRELCLTLATLRERVHQEENKMLGVTCHRFIPSREETANDKGGNFCPASSYFSTKKFLPFYYFFWMTIRLKVGVGIAKSAFVGGAG